MDDLERWLRRERDRDDRRPVLEQALLGGRFWRYALYRLRYFLAWHCLSAAVHAATVLLLYRAFPHSFSLIFVAYAAVNVGESFWWGALEAMRGRIRVLYRQGKPYLVSGEIGRWLSLAVQAAMATVIAIAGWAAWLLVSPGNLTPAKAYVAVILLSFAAQLPTRCYHSGIYALRRVRRPVQAMIALELVNLGMILSMRPLLGSWGFPVAALVSIVAVTCVTWFYTRKSYHLLRLAPEKYLDLRTVQLPRRGQRSELMIAGTSFALMSLDALLVLILFGTRSRGGSSLFLLFFVISPAVRAGFDWARLLYFDLKRLEIRLFRNLRRRFRFATHQLALMLGLFFWGAASVMGTVVLGHGLGLLYWLLLPFFVFRSLLAMAQMDAFAEGSYGALLANGCACFGGIVGVAAAVRDQRLALVGIAAVTLLAFLWLITSRAGLWLPRHHEPQWLSEWLTDAAATFGATRVCAARLSTEPLITWTKTVAEWEQMQRRRRKDLAEQIARRLRSFGRVAIGPQGEVIWCERAGGRRLVTAAWLSKRSGGFVKSVHDAGLHESGARALGSACDQGLLGWEFAAAVQERQRVTLHDIKCTFAELFPDGIVYSPDEQVPAALASLSAREQQKVFSAAASFARAFRPAVSHSRFDVSAFCESGQLRLIFAVPADAGAAQHWGELIRKFNIDAAVGALPFDRSAAALAV